MTKGKIKYSGIYCISKDGGNTKTFHNYEEQDMINALHRWRKEADKNNCSFACVVRSNFIKTSIMVYNKEDFKRKKHLLYPINIPF